MPNFAASAAPNQAALRLISGAKTGLSIGGKFPSNGVCMQDWR
jgi:hypothetical protein